MKFEQLNIIPPILNALAEQGYETPTPIQEKALPPALEGRDVLGCAQTGTGKTCAFAVPILQRLNAHPSKKHPIRALVLTPTRELAIQIQECFEAYGKYLPLRSTVIYGGVGQNPQAEALSRGTDILVATPGRLQDLHDQGLVHVDQLEVLVLDEADRMLDMGFIHDVRRILAWLPEKKQTLFFSATMPAELNDLVSSLLHDPVRAAVDPISSPVERIEQRLYYVDKGNKTKLLYDLLEQEQIPSALVFTRTKHGANKVADELSRRGVNAEAIHGNKSQTARQNALNGFKAGTVRVLVATDIAARGLDIEELPYVFNYNLSEVPETYIHRIGRTGRAGRGGTAISFCDITETEMLRDIEKLLGKKIPVVETHAYPMTVLEAPKKDKNGRIINPEDQEARQAARQKRQARSAAPGPGGKEDAPAAEQKQAAPSAKNPEEPKSAARKSKKKKKKSAEQSGQQGKTQPAAEASEQPRQIPEVRKPEPKTEDESLPAALRSPGTKRPYSRPVRMTSLDDFLKEIGAEDESDYSEFPLLEQRLREERTRGDYLDATDRLLSTHSSKYRDAYGGGKTAARGRNAGKQSASGSVPQKKTPRDGKKSSAQQQGKEPAQQAPSSRDPAAKTARQKSAAGPSVPASGTQPPANQSASDRPTQKKSGKKQSAGKAKTDGKQAQNTSVPQQPKDGRLLNVKSKKNRTYKTPPPMQRSHYATQKDSTEQKSLMKPYYISVDKKEK